jgi:hypothetical protein
MVQELVDYGRRAMKKGRDAFVLVSAGAIMSVGACSSTPVPANGDAGAPPVVCGDAPAVEDTGLQQCLGCSPPSPCTQAEPLSACCVRVAAPKNALADGTGLHRYSTDEVTATPALACLTQPGVLGTPQSVTLTGYVGLFSTGEDSQGVKVDIFTENHPQTPDGSIGSASLGTYTTTASDPVDPVGTTWKPQCPNGCSYRQYAIQNVPTETPLVIRTSDAGSGGWATVYEYNVYFADAEVQGGQVTYDATAATSSDLSAVAGGIGLSPENGMGLLTGEVHDCNDVRLFGATVEAGSPQAHQGPLFYFSEDEADPQPSLASGETSHLGLFGAIDMPPDTPIRVSAVGEDPSSPGQFLMLGTYVIQFYPGAMTTLALRGRRPWQP